MDMYDPWRMRVYAKEVHELLWNSTGPTAFGTIFLFTLDALGNGLPAKDISSETIQPTVLRERWTGPHSILHLYPLQDHHFLCDEEAVPFLCRSSRLSTGNIGNPEQNRFGCLSDANSRCTCLHEIVSGFDLARKPFNLADDREENENTLSDPEDHAMEDKARPYQKVTPMLPVGDVWTAQKSPGLLSCNSD